MWSSLKGAFRSASFLRVGIRAQIDSFATSTVSSKALPVDDEKSSNYRFYLVINERVPSQSIKDTAGQLKRDQFKGDWYSAQLKYGDPVDEAEISRVHSNIVICFHKSEKELQAKIAAKRKIDHATNAWFVEQKSTKTMYVVDGNHRCSNLKAHPPNRKEQREWNVFVIRSDPAAETFWCLRGTPFTEANKRQNLQASFN